MYGLSASKTLYADFPDKIIYVHLLIENLISEVIILIDVCHFDQATAHRCFVRTILQVSLSPCLSRLTFFTADWKKKIMELQKEKIFGKLLIVMKFIFTTDIILFQ